MKRGTFGLIVAVVLAATCPAPAAAQTSQLSPAVERALFDYCKILRQCLPQWHGQLHRAHGRAELYIFPGRQA